MSVPSLASLWPFAIRVEARVLQFSITYYYYYYYYYYYFYYY